MLGWLRAEPALDLDEVARRLAASAAVEAPTVADAEHQAREYVLRTALTGAHLLATGRLVTDLTALIDDHGFAGARELLEIKRAGERTPLPADVATRWMPEAQRAFGILDGALERSPLPEEAPNRAEMEDWLIAFRRSRF